MITDKGKFKAINSNIKFNVQTSNSKGLRITQIARIT